MTRAQAAETSALIAAITLLPATAQAQSPAPPALTVSRDQGLPVTLSIASTQTFSYDDARRFKRRALTVSVGVSLP